MKRVYVIVITLLLISYWCIDTHARKNENDLPASDSIRLLTSPDLYTLSAKWAEEYTRLYPETKFRVTSVTDTRAVNDLLAKGNIGFLSNEFYSGFSGASLWKIVVGRDVIVPVISSKNPYLAEISQKGISPENFALFLSSNNSRKWGTLLKNTQNSTTDFYYINDKSISEAVAGFLKTDKKNITGNKVENADEFLAAIKKDPLAIGFCKMINILNLKSQNLADEIRLLPIDRNGNGIIDYNEKIYDDLNGFSRGIWIGKYPKTLISNIYSVSPIQPKSKTEVAFLKWILSDGQQFLYSNGFSDLLVSERQSTSEKLINAQTYVSAAPEEKSLLRAVLFFLAVIVLSGIIIDLAVRTIRKRNAPEQLRIQVNNIVLNENSMKVPGGMYFDKTHTWAFLEKDGAVKVGVDDFLQHVTGPLTRVSMKKEGEKVRKGESVLTLIQNGKQLNVYAPVSGTIKEINKLLNSDASKINTSPYDEGWVYKIEPSNWLRENQLLFMAEKQRQFISKEFTRLKDFLALALKDDSEKYACVILQDGGELSDSTLSNLGPKVWEDFQTKFIDPSRQVWFYELF